MRLISSAAFGIPLYEIRNATVVASNKINMPRFLETVWDVTKHLMKGHMDRKAKMILNSAIHFCGTKKNSRSEKPTHGYGNELASTGLKSRYTMDREQKTPLLNRVEERTKEAIGAVGLTHLGDHSDALIAEAVANFIVSEQIPEGAVQPLKKSKRRLRRAQTK